ncbi:MAG: lysine--tRNA ligase [Candidatus Pacebacteria bacterium]|nr:lysine--tRNA ligase [Candidatus Paceibacterota bacterium]
MSSNKEVRQVRLEKLEKIKARGVNPYPAKTDRQFSLADISGVDIFEKFSAEKKSVTLAGRVMSLRPQGALIFLHIYDGTAKFQGLLKKDDVVKNDFDFFNEVVDIGDFVELTGTLFTTKRGEKTLEVTSWKMLSKSLRDLPEKWHGIQDPDARLRRRYLDILFNEDVRELFVKKSLFWNAVRTFLQKEGFLEVETPVLETTTGGADARPFATHHNALDIDVFLRISCGELWQKQLMVAGYPKVFEIGRIFRNEGMSAEHAQDYTQLEWYWAYADAEKGMELTERLYKYVAQETFGTLIFTIGEHQIDLGQKWERYDYTETIKKMTGIDIKIIDLAAIEKKLHELKVTYDKKGWNKSRAIDSLWKYCRKNIPGPGFLVGVPKEISPLAKTSETDPTVVERFQPLIAGSELGNGYSELNDPIDQAERFEAQSKLREAGDDEAQMFAHEFVEALEYGMPPTCGFGMSERVFAFLANTSIREAQIFPLMKPRQGGGAADIDEE